MFVNPNPQIWLDPNNASQAFHPGAAACMRSKNRIKNGAGQQCCYDFSGSLITHGPGAGTPDMSAPIGFPGLPKHWIQDVVAFNMAIFLDEYCTRFPQYLDMYIELRPPNPGANRAGQPCTKNP